MPLFGDGKRTHVERLSWFTAESFGGPDRFAHELGFRHLLSVHRGLKITDAQRQRFAEVYRKRARRLWLARGEAELPRRHRRRVAPRCARYPLDPGRRRTASIWVSEALSGYERWL